MASNSKWVRRSHKAFSTPSWTATRSLAIAVSLWSLPSFAPYYPSGVEGFYSDRNLCHFSRYETNPSPKQGSFYDTRRFFSKIDTAETTRHLPRLYIDSEFSAPFRPRSLVPLTFDQEHYLLDVMRITNSKRWGKGDLDYTGCVRVFNGSDGEWLAKVVEDSTNKKQRRKRQRTKSDEPSGTVLECMEEVFPQPVKSKIGLLQLYVGYLRDKQRRRWIFEKATELGIDGITMLQTDFGNNSDFSKFRWEDDREKHKAHVIEAAEQCERLTVPCISEEALSVSSLVERMVGSSDVWLVCRERSETSPPILEALHEIPPETTVHLLVGPEGGWSPAELETFSELPEIRFVSLGSSVLRAETAVITAVASIQMYRESIL